LTGKIVVADDQQVNLEIMKIHFIELGISTADSEFCGDGQQCINRCE
jgi:CheY-like chemotaxis protein